MNAHLELWTNLWSPEELMGLGAKGAFLSDEQRRSVDAVFREAINTTEGRFAIALGRSAEELSTDLYVHYEPLAYLVVALDPFEKKVSVCANSAYWPAMERHFTDMIKKGETLLGEDRVVEALGLCIREGLVCVTSMMRLGPP